jgi:hypothetical protein
MIGATASPARRVGGRRPIALSRIVLLVLVSALLGASSPLRADAQKWGAPALQVRLTAVHGNVESAWFRCRSLCLARPESSWLVWSLARELDTAKLNPWGAFPNPYAVFSNPFTVKPNPYGAFPNPFTVKPNPYGAFFNPYDVKFNPH